MVLGVVGVAAVVAAARGVDLTYDFFAACFCCFVCFVGGGFGFGGGWAGLLGAQNTKVGLHWRKHQKIRCSNARQTSFTFVSCTYSLPTATNKRGEGYGGK